MAEMFINGQNYIFFNVHNHFIYIYVSADGIALGAAVTTSHTDIEMIVFTAIMLHKVRVTIVSALLPKNSENVVFYTNYIL